jgi:hypothetical protein
MKKVQKNDGVGVTIETVWADLNATYPYILVYCLLHVKCVQH